MKDGELKAVVFDFRDTLINVAPAYAEMESAAFRFLNEKGCSMPKSTFASNYTAAVKTVKNKLSGKPVPYDWDMLLKELLRLSGTKLSKEEFNILRNRYGRAFYQNVKLYGDAKQALRNLKAQGYKTGVVIDGDSKTERFVLKKFGLDKLLDAVAISGEIGKPKVSGVPLKRCIKALGIKGSEAAVIGDRLDKDIKPANSVGAISVRLIRKGGRYSEAKTTNALERPTYTISNLSALDRLREERDKKIKNKKQDPIQIVVGMVIANKEGKILTVKTPFTGKHHEFTLPGGHVEYSERLEDTVRRETMEEVGLKVKVVGFLNVHDAMMIGKDGRRGHFIGLNYFCTSESSNPKPDGLEVKECIWMEPKEILKKDVADYVSGSVKDALRLFGNHLSHK